MKNLLTSLVFLWSFGGVLACPEACSCTLQTKGTHAYCYNARLGYFPTNFPTDTYSIELGNNDIKTVNVKICSLYPELEILYLKSNQITFLKDDVFADCRNLKTLWLNSNALSSINSSMFRNSTNLVELNLSYNSISTIHPDTFMEVPNLERLDLSENKITRIPEYFLVNKTSLQYLYLQNNEITDIHMNAFVNLRRIDTLYLHNNKILAVSGSIFKSMNSLRYLDLSQNSISSLPENSFVNLNNLYSLSLHHNNLSSIAKHVLVNKTNLYYLRLQNNMLATVDPIIFQNMDNLYELYLDNNNIREIKSGMPRLTNLNKMYLSGNPLVCDCGILTFYEWATETPSIAADARCTSGKNLIYMTSKDFWKCSFLDCECFNGGSCVTNADNSTACECVGNWSGEKCQVSQCTSYDCGDDVCYTEPENGTAICKDSLCRECECYNGGYCVTAKDNSIKCQCVGNWTGDKCQVSQCTSYDCGDDVCYTESQNGTARCKSSFVKDCECYNGGSCVTMGDKTMKCQCVGNWTGERCQVSQCAAFDCGDYVCYTEAHNGTAYCGNSLCKDTTTDMTTEEPTTIAPISTTPCLSGNFQNRTSVGLDEDCGMYSSTGMCTVLHSACTQNDGSSNIWQCKCTQGYAPKGGSCVRVPGALFTDAYRTQTVSISPTTARTTVFNAIFSEVNGFATTNPQASIIGSEAANFEINSLTNQGFQVETKMKPTQIRYEVTIVVSVQMGNNVIRDHVHIVVNVDLGIIEKSFLVFEGTPPGSVVGFICTSCLQSGAFVLSPTTSDITVNNNGTVTINKDLDFERSPNLLAYSRRYDIKQQGGSTSVIARIKLVFVRRTYISELNEGSTDATIVGQFENLDSPSIENSNEAGFKVSTSSSSVTYLTLGTNRVNASISSKLDKRITVRTGDVIFTTRIFIQVIDVNNNPPIFQQSSYSFTMIQSIYPDLIVGFVKADDKDANTVLTYKIVPDDKLKIDNNGVISIKSPFTNKEENYTATVTAMDEDLAGTANVRFTIIKGTEQNLNHNFTGEINENANAGAQVANVFVAKHGKYSFTDQAAFRDFRIDDTTGIVTSARPFDREKEQLFKYTVVGNNLDEASCTLVVIGEVTITIKDLNDEIPAFDHSSYNAEVPEGESNTKLKMNVQISAKDKDLNSTITYSVANHTDKFRIANSNTGVIETLTALDRETSATYTVLVKASDTVNAGTATVTVTVLDKNDNKPQFTNIGTGISVSEGVKTGSNVYTISATDPDEGKNAEITYDLDSVGGFFKMNQTTGEITTLRSLDRETDSSHTIIVYARDNGDTIQSVSETITVTVTDVNDNSPVFSQSEVVVSFNESQACSTSIMTITATDADQPNHQNSQITYSIKSGADKFVIDNTNLLKCVQPFDFETAKSHQVIIIAQDNGTPRRTAEQKVTVQIQDLNDNRPVFKGAPYSTTIRYITGEWQSGRLVLAVSATDADAGVNGEVTYTISGAAFLQINGKSGVISTTNQTPSNSQYQLIVTATDGGSSPLSSSTTIAVTIDTITTQPVRFNKQEFNMTIEENKPTNTQVESVSSGVIRPIGTSLSFEIVDSDVSKIPLTLTNDGKVQVSGDIDRESKDVYEFIVKVKNTAANDQSDLSLVRVSITDVNDNVPNFDKIGLYTFTISENSNIGASATPDVEDIKASDSDIGDNAVIEFVIEGVSTCTNSFTLKNPGSSNRRLVTLKTKVDYEQVKSCRFFVTAYNPNKREMNSTTDVLVRIRDFNDNEPEFSGATNGVYSIKVPEDTTINSEVIYIGMVTDADDNENGDVELSSDNNCPFKFERDFGEESRRFGLKLKTGENLDYETGRKNIDCQLTATDKANPPMPRLASTVTVNIEITDVNDNAPTFNDSDKQIRKQVSRDADVNHTVIDNLPATDLDSGVNGQLIYSLRPSQYSSYFTIRSSDGRLAVNAHLVSVPKDELTLTAIVSDNGIPPRHDELLVQIELLDQNPRPYFLSQEKVSFREHSIRPDGVISKVVAYDRKSGIVQECDCTYYLDTRREDIVIESTTGTIKFLYSNGTLDREKEAGGRVIFGVIAEDKERPPKNSSTMSFVIEIEDINDNSPFFQNQEYSFVFHQNTPDGTVIGTMKAIDRDLNPVTLYSINSTTDTDGRMITDIVQINERTGEITKSGNTTLSSVENAVITGFVTARDGKDDKPPSISLLRIVIEYDDKNNHTPTFERQKYESELDWSSPAKKFILQVNATDDDKDAQGRVHYYIERGNTRGFFDIHNTTGVLTLAYLLDSSIGTGNRETIMLKIKAQDGGIIPKYSFADVRIVITGINPGVCVQQAEHSRQLVDLEAERNSWSGALYGLVAALCIAIIACCFLIYKWRTSVSLPEEETSNTNNKHKNFDHATYSDLSKSQREVEYSQSNQAFDPPSLNIDFESGKDEYTRVDEGLGATSSFRDTLSVDEPKPDYSPYMKQRMKPVMPPEVPSDKSEPASTSFNPMFRS